jgi:hypothetical protein
VTGRDEEMSEAEEISEDERAGKTKRPAIARSSSTPLDDLFRQF